MFYHVSKESILIWCLKRIACLRFSLCEVQKQGMREHHLFCRYIEYFEHNVCILAVQYQNESGFFPLQTDRTSCGLQLNLRVWRQSWMIPDDDS